MKTAIILSLLFLHSLSAQAWDHTYRVLQDSVLAPFTADGRVDYAGLSVHRAGLDRFLDECGTVSFDEYRSFSREQKMAFLINIYNAAAIRLVLDHWPVASIRDAGGFFISPWTRKFILLFGRTVGLGQILHDILRPEFRDPRLHFALSNASRSGPALPAEPYQPQILEDQLRRQTEMFLRERPDCNRYHDGTLELSPIFRWYENDFGKRAGVIAFVKPYFPELTDSTAVRYSEYDWSLNSR